MVWGKDREIWFMEFVIITSSPFSSKYIYYFFKRFVEGTCTESDFSIKDYNQICGGSAILVFYNLKTIGNWTSEVPAEHCTWKTMIMLEYRFSFRKNSFMIGSSLKVPLKTEPHTFATIFNVHTDSSDVEVESQDIRGVLSHLNYRFFRFSTF